MSKVFSTRLMAVAYQNRFGGTITNAMEQIYFFQELLQEELYRGHPVNLPMIGKFTAIFKPSRDAIDPRNGLPTKTKARYTVKYRPSQKMLDWINKNRQL